MYILIRKTYMYKCECIRARADLSRMYGHRVSIRPIVYGVLLDLNDGRVYYIRNEFAIEGLTTQARQGFFDMNRTILRFNFNKKRNYILRNARIKRRDERN